MSEGEAGMNATTRGRWIALACGISGAAGLVHELVWTRRIELLVGTSLRTAAAVLAVTLGGMAIGAALAGRREDRREEGVRAYAAYEFALAIYCLLLPFMQELAAPLFGLIQQHSGTMAPPLRDALAMALVLPGALLMGATFPPVVADLVRAAPSDPAGNLARVYGANTFGAFLGALAGGLLLRPWLGTQGTLYVACAMSVLAGILALKAPEVPTPAGGRPSAPAATPGAATDTTARLTVYAIYGLSGFTALAYEVLLHRMASLWIGGSTYAFAMVLAVFLLGLSAGASLVKGRRIAGVGAFGALALVQGGVALWVLALGAVAGRLPLLLAKGAGFESLPFSGLLGAQFLVLLVLLLPGTLCLGASLPVAASCLGIGPRDSGSLVGRLYGANSMGCVLGALLGGHLLLPVLGLRGSLLAVGAVNLATACLAARRAWPATRWVPAAAVVLGLGALVPAWDAAVLSSGPYIYGSAYQKAAGESRDVLDVIKACGEVLFHRDGAYATTTIRKAPGGLLSLQVNGKTDASNKADMFTQRLVAHLPLLVHPDPKEVLVIGLGSGVTAGAVLDHPVDHVDTLEIAPEVVEASRWFDELTGAPLDDPRNDLHVQDGRAWVQWTDRSYDVLSSEPSNPWVAGMANLFTEEYFRACRQRLRPGGVMVQWVQAYSTSPEDFRSVVATFHKVFPKASLWRSMNQTDFVLLGLTDGPRPDGAEMARRILADDRRGKALRDHGLDVRQLALAFVADTPGVAALAGDAPLVTDDDPFLEFTGPKNLYKNLISEVYAAIQEHADATGLARILENPEALIVARGEVETAIELRDQALALALHGDAGEAARLLEAVLKRLPDDELTRNSYASLMKERARTLRKAGEPAAAGATLDRLLERVPDDVEARHLRGLARTEVGDLAAARADLEVVLDELPSDKTAFRNLSVILYKQGELGGALGAFLRSLQGVQPSAKEWRSLAELYRGTGEFPKAALCWKRSLELDEDQPEIRELFRLYVEVAGEDGVASGLGTEE